MSPIIDTNMHNIVLLEGESHSGDLGQIKNKCVSGDRSENFR